jgi:hypothetical protein
MVVAIVLVFQEYGNWWSCNVIIHKGKYWNVVREYQFVISFDGSNLHTRMFAVALAIRTVEFVSLRRHALRDCVNFTNFAFWIKYHFNVGI